MHPFCNVVQMWFPVWLICYGLHSKSCEHDLWKWFLVFDLYRLMFDLLVRLFINSFFIIMHRQLIYLFPLYSRIYALNLPSTRQSIRSIICIFIKSVTRPFIHRVLIRSFVDLCILSVFTCGSTPISSWKSVDLIHGRARTRWTFRCFRCSITFMYTDSSISSCFKTWSIRFFIWSFAVLVFGPAPACGSQT